MDKVTVGWQPRPVIDVESLGVHCRHIANRFALKQPPVVIGAWLVSAVLPLVRSAVAQWLAWLEPGPAPLHGDRRCCVGRGRPGKAREDRVGWDFVVMHPQHPRRG